MTGVGGGVGRLAGQEGVGVHLREAVPHLRRLQRAEQLKTKAALGDQDEMTALRLGTAVGMDPGMARALGTKGVSAHILMTDRAMMRPPTTNELKESLSAEDAAKAYADYASTDPERQAQGAATLTQHGFHLPARTNQSEKSKIMNDPVRFQQAVDDEMRITPDANRADVEARVREQASGFMNQRPHPSSSQNRPPLPVSRELMEATRTYRTMNKGEDTAPTDDEMELAKTPDSFFSGGKHAKAKTKVDAYNRLLAARAAYDKAGANTPSPSPRSSDGGVTDQMIDDLIRDAMREEQDQ